MINQDNMLYALIKAKALTVENGVTISKMHNVQYLINQVLELSGCGVFDRSEHDDFNEVVNKYKESKGDKLMISDQLKELCTNPYDIDCDAMTDAMCELTAESGVKEMDKLLKLQSMCKASITININDHLSVYQSAGAYLEEEVGAFHLGERVIPHDKVLFELDVKKETFDRMVDNNSVVRIQFFPHTPIGSYTIYDSDLDRALDRCLMCV